MEKHSTILINSKTREMLKQIGMKGQTYDDLIIALIKIKRKTENLLDHKGIASPNDQAIPEAHR